ncbi:MAG: PorT family protein [Saprospiraceae bacterium]|nr:PorT family protein [Saprospiraceae bacterium]MDW8483915.1 porin family protein [Saprospiraceae bacterium]
MEALPDKEEQYVREQLMQYEFPFDEAAWEAMEVLLVEARQRARKRRVAILRYAGLVLFVISGAAAALLVLWAIFFKPRKNALPKSGEIAVVYPLRQQVGDLPSSRSENHLREAGLLASGKPSAREVCCSTEQNLTVSATNQAPGFQGNLAAVSSKVAADFAPEPAKEEENQAPLEGVALSLPLPMRVAPSLLWLNRDELIHQVRPCSWDFSPRLEHALTLGLGASIWQWNPLAVSPAPLVGYLIRYRFSTHTSLQAEFQVKSSSGYPLYVREEGLSFGGGSRQQGKEIHSLLFFEAPVCIHHRYRTNQAVFLGIRPSYNILIPAQMLQSSAVSQNEHLLREKINSLDVGIGLGWEWRMHPHWAFDARLTHGLLNLVSEDFFHGVDRLYNVDLQLSVRYFLTPDKRTLISRL